MNSIVPHIPEQLSKIAAGQTACRQHQKALIETVRSLNSTVVQHQELRASLQQEYDTSLRVHDERTAAEFRRRTEQSDSVAAAKLAEIDADRLRTVGEANGVCHDEQKQVQQAFEHENWVLQSVCDDEGEDTPITRSRSFAETFENQSQVMDELLVTLRERIKNTDQYLTRCHAGMESELPASSLTNGTREENREAAQKHSNEAFLAADQIDGLMIPGWVSGFRLLIIFFFITIVLLVPVASLRSDVRAFFSPELGNPDWGWLGVSALISGGVALLTSTVLMVIAQQQLRSRFQMMLQHASDAEAACGWWKTQSARESERMNHSAAAWQTQLIEQRDRRGAALAASFQNKQNVILQTLRDTTADIEQKASLQSEDVRRAQAAERSAAEAWRAEETAKFREQRRIEFEAAVSHADAECAQTIAALAETQKQVIDRWNGVLRETAAFSQLCTDTVSGVVQWPNLKDNRIPIPETLPSVLAAGNLHFTLAGLPPQNAPEENTVVSLEMPAILRFPTDTGIVVRHDTVGRESALEFVRAIILKLLTTIPPGRIQLTLIDPVGLGESFSALMHIADFDELLIGSRIWTESGQIRERLRKITDHMENVFQTYLRSEFSTIEQYNAAAGEVAEPYHFVIIAGFPTSFTEESARHLTSILASGPRCGVRPIITWDTDTVVPGWFDVTNLTKECIEFQVINRKVHLKGQDAVVSDAATIRYDSLQPPASSEYVRYVRAIGEASRGARRVEVSFARIAPREENIWTYSTAEGIDLPIGRAGAARLQTMKLGRGTSQHVLIAGKTGSGKSTLLHILITNMALHYSPNEIQFYLI
ncbi:MAG: FtsK/SpoIIIE domain-containing protein, partial [Planctomyces sp.]